ncbi:MAG: SgcJ/EcaC family oxidoreductase [Acidobacteriota bacterium]
MRTLYRSSGLAVCVFLAAVSLRAQSQSATPADEKDIRDIGAQIQEAWNKGDAKMIAALWLTDGDYVSSTGRMASGREQVEKAFSEQWAAIYRRTRIVHTLTTVRFVRRDVAIADGAFEITGMKDASGKSLGSRSGLTTVVVAKKGDRWYVAALRGMVPTVPAGSPGK